MTARKIIFILSFLIVWLKLPVHAQEFQLYSFSGTVQLKTVAGDAIPLVLDTPLDPNVIVNVAKGGSICILDRGRKTVCSKGECHNIPVSQIVSESKTSFWGKLESMIKGVSPSDQAYVSHKGDNPRPEFAFALHQDQYTPAYQVSLEIVDHHTGIATDGPIRDGQTIHFRVRNAADIPLCIGILWKDSAGNLENCLESEDRFVLIPADSTVELDQIVLEVAPPFGRDVIYLFAAPDFFALHTLADEEIPETSTGIPIGFSSKQVLILR